MLNSTQINALVNARLNDTELQTKIAGKAADSLTSRVYSQTMVAACPAFASLRKEPAAPKAPRRNGARKPTVADVAARVAVEAAS